MERLLKQEQQHHRDTETRREASASNPPVSPIPGTRNSKIKTRSCFSVCLCGALLLSGVARAQWVDQPVTLNPGWNAIYLEVAPEPADTATVFPLPENSSVWMWNKRFSPVQFLQDASELLPTNPDWLVWFPPTQPASVNTTLHTIQGGRAYLVRYSGAGQTTVTVRGKPTERTPEWVSDSFNFVGFGLQAGSEPTFGQFFQYSPAHTAATSKIFRLNGSGQWVEASRSDAMKRGESFWIYTVGQSTYPGPFGVEFEQAGGLQFGAALVDQGLILDNKTDAAKTYTLSLGSSASNPVTSDTLVAGDVPLSVFKVETSTHRDGTASISDIGYVPIAGSTQVTVAAGERQLVKLAVRRDALAPAPTPGAGTTGREFEYQSVMTITDGSGTARKVGVASNGPGPTVVTAAARPNGRAGLWVGSVTVDAISQPEGSNPTVPLTVSPPTQFRVIFHVNSGGQVSLLNQATLMFKPGTTSAPGHHVIVTEDSLLGPSSPFTGATLKDGEPVGRRVSSTMLAWDSPRTSSTLSLAPTPHVLQVGGSFDTGSLDASFALSYNNPLNPFYDRYHPDHDNKDFRFVNWVDNPATTWKDERQTECYTVARALHFSISPTDVDGLVGAGYGDNRLSGTYAETISGLHRRAINMSGTFRIQHVSPVAVLNDGL